MTFPGSCDSLVAQEAWRGVQQRGAWGLLQGLCWGRALLLCVTRYWAKRPQRSGHCSAKGETQDTAAIWEGDKRTWGSTTLQMKNNGKYRGSSIMGYSCASKSVSGSIPGRWRAVTCTHWTALAVHLSRVSHDSLDQEPFVDQEPFPVNHFPLGHPTLEENGGACT